MTTDLYTPKNPVRIVTSAALFDGHDAAINVMRRIMQATGVEVIHLGHNRSVGEVVEAAVQEDADGIAVSSYQGGHVEYFQYMVDMLRERDAGHVRVFGGGGGVIIPEEIDALHDGHPEFEPLERGAREPSNLHFGHTRHVVEVMERNEWVDHERACLFCHRPIADGTRFEPLDFAAVCDECHGTGEEVNLHHFRKVYWTSFSPLLRSAEGGLAAWPMGKGSGSVTAFSRADGFVRIPRNTEIVEADGAVEVRRIGRELPVPDLVVIGSHCAGLDLIASRRVDVSATVTHRVGLGEAQRGFDLVVAADESLKVIIEPQR